MPTKTASEGLKIKGRAKGSSSQGQNTELKRKKKAKQRKRQPQAQPDGASEEELEAILRDLAASDDGPMSPEGREDTDSEGLEEDLRFDGAENLASPEAGPSRLPMTPAGTSFTPLPRSVLSGFSKRPSISPERSPSPPAAAAGTIPHSSRPKAAPPPTDHSAVGPHFQPPGLFSTTVDKAIQAQTSITPLPSTPSAQDTTAPSESASKRDLLLPDNIIVDGAESETKEAGDAEGAGDVSMEGLFFLDDNIQRGAQRYFVPEQTEKQAFLATADQSKICQNCKQPGHRHKDCPHTICTVCGAVDEHERRDCPHGITCFGCGQQGHRQSDCPDPVARHSRKRGCGRCGSREHPEGLCPTIWRIYKYFSNEERNDMQDKKRKAKDWTREALGDVEVEMFCYNCANSGHLGDDCPRPRASAAKLFNPTAFSHAMARRGPYYSQNGAGQTRNTPLATHTRFDDDAALPGTAPGFAGGNAGKKSREKARKAMIDREARAGLDEEDDWFSKRSGAQFTPNGPSRSSSVRGRGGKTNGTPRNRLWDSDSRPTQGRNDPERGMPFGHSHLMATAPPSARGKGISFQSFELPGTEVNSPLASKGKGKKTKTPAAKSILERAIKGAQREQPRLDSPRDSPMGLRDAAPSPSPHDNGTMSSRKRRRKKKDDEDVDLESAWWSSGKAGGNVSGWGKDLPNGSGGKKQGSKGNKGQQYTGGY